MCDTSTRRSAIVFRHDAGASAVEFALLAPVFLFLMIGAVAYGLYFGAAHSVQQLAADAARVSIAGLTPDERVALVENYLAGAAGEYVLINTAQLRATVGPNPTDPEQFVVALTYDASELPIWNLDLPLPASRDIVFTSVIRNGGA